MKQGDAQISELIFGFLDHIPKAYFTLADLVEELKERSFGVLLLLVAIPNAFLLAAIPGVSFFFGLLIIFVSIELICRLDKAWLPSSLNQFQFSKDHCESVLQKTKPYIQKLDKFVKPRLSFMTSAYLERFLGVICFIHGVIVALPVPLGNFTCGVAMLFLALGLIARDGILMIIGYLLSFSIFIFFAVSFRLILRLTYEMLGWFVT